MCGLALQQVIGVGIVALILAALLFGSGYIFGALRANAWYAEKHKDTLERLRRRTKEREHLSMFKGEK